MQAKEEADNAKEDGAAPEKPASNAEKVDDLGMSVATLTDPLRLQYEVKKDVAGVVVTAVTGEGVAAEQGIQTGDVIAEAAQQDVKTPKELIEQATGEEGQQAPAPPRQPQG